MQAAAKSAAAQTCPTTDTIATRQVKQLLSSLHFSAYHVDITAGGLVLCGGQNTQTSCITLDPGTKTWSNQANIAKRNRHVSWVTTTGQLYLMGGSSGQDDSDQSLFTTEIVGAGQGFSLVGSTGEIR